jgi:hypothetical protein
MTKSGVGGEGMWDEGGAMKGLTLKARRFASIVGGLSRKFV